MNKIVAPLVITLMSGGFLFSQNPTPEQKRVQPILEKAILQCYSECKKTKNQATCDNGIDALEEAMRNILNAAATGKVNASSESVAKSAELMNTICSAEGKNFVDALGR